jgi:5'-nucleotidase
MTKPYILVTNDDGITSPGINALIEVAKKIGEVVVVAPDKPQSGKGHAITIDDTLRYQIIMLPSGVKGYSCSGTPVDCVKLAVNVICKDKKPDLIISGINHGSNASVNVLYSGTMSAAVEGALEGVPSVGFSLLDHSIDADFSASQEIAERVIKSMLTQKIPDGVCLNVNIPKLKSEEIMGIKVCRQARANWEEEFDSRKDPSGKEYFWLTGIFKNYDEGKDTDIWALENNYASVVPVHIDMTAHHFLNELKTWKLS